TGGTYGASLRIFLCYKQVAPMEQDYFESLMNRTAGGNNKNQSDKLQYDFFKVSPQFFGLIRENSSKARLGKGVFRSLAVKVAINISSYNKNRNKSFRFPATKL